MVQYCRPIMLFINPIMHPIRHKMRPVTACFGLVDSSPWVPRMAPMTLMGRPMSGMIQVNRPMMPSTKAATAWPFFTGLSAPDGERKCLMTATIPAPMQPPIPPQIAPAIIPACRVTVGTTASTRQTTGITFSHASGSAFCLAGARAGCGGRTFGIGLAAGGIGGGGCDCCAVAVAALFPSRAQRGHSVAKGSIIYPHFGHSITHLMIRG